MEQSAKIVSEVSSGKDSYQVSGNVTANWSHRAIQNNDSEDYEDDGPLRNRFSNVHNITITSSNETNTTSPSINLFFYDDWAEKSESICIGDSVTVTGSKELVFDNRYYEDNDGEHPSCLAFRTEEQSITSPTFEVTVRRKGVKLLRLIFPGQCDESQNKSPSSRSPSSSIKRHKPESVTHTRSVTRSATEHEHEHDSVTETTVHSRSPSQQQKNTPNQLKSISSQLHEVHDLEGIHGKVKSVRDFPTDGYTGIAAAKGQEVRPVYGHGWTPLGDAESFKDQNITILGVVVSFQVSPKPCGGSHSYSCTYTLVDPTRSNPQFPVVLNVFANTLAEFPHCIRAGDVLLCVDVRVNIHHGFLKLIGSNKSESCSDNFSFVVFSRKVNYVTGFPRLMAQQDSRDQTDMTWGFSLDEWAIHQSNKRRRVYPVTPAAVERMSAWSECLFLQSQVGGKSPCELSLDQAFLHTSSKGMGKGIAGVGNSWSSDVKGRCDVTCMVAAVICPDRPISDDVEKEVPLGVTTLLLWDGSTAGDLTPHEAVNKSDYNDMSISIHSAMLFPKVTASEEFSSLPELREKMNVPCVIPDRLYGMPLAVTSVPGDVSTAQRLKLLKAGMWLRLRNLHIDSNAKEASFPSASSSSSTSHAHALHHASSSTSIVSLPSPTTSTAPSTAISATLTSTITAGPAAESDGCQTQHTTLTHIVGTIHSDTYFSLLLPYFKDIRHIAVNYEIRCQNAVRQKAALLRQSLAAAAAKQQQQHAQELLLVKAMEKPLRKILNADGVKYTNLALCLSKKPPRVYCSIAHIVSYRPSDVARFVCERPAKGLEPLSFVFRFSLMIKDDSTETDAMLFDKDAEIFLGVTAEEFQNDSTIRERIEKKLMELCTLHARTEQKNEVEIVEDLDGEVEVVKEVAPALDVRTMDFTLTSYQTVVTVNGIMQESVKLAVSNTKIM